MKIENHLKKGSNWALTIRPLHLFANKLDILDQKIKSILNNKLLFSILLFSIFVWFIFQAVFFALNVIYTVPPDEGSQLITAKLYNESNCLTIENSPKTYWMGNVKTRPLYPMIMGKIFLNINNIFGISDYIFLRIINVILGIFFMFFSYLMIKEVTKNKLIQLSILIILSNLMMLVFLYGAISRDNLTNLIAVMSIYYMIKFIKTCNRFYLLMILLTMVIGSLTKISYLPLIVIELAIFLFFIKEIINNKDKLLVKKIKIKELSCIVVIIILGIANVMHYGGNLIKYKTLEPSLGQAEGKNIKSSNEKVYIMLAKTAHTRDKMNIFEYSVEWYKSIKDKTLGIMAHRHLHKSNNNIQMVLVNIIILISTIILLLNTKKLFKDKPLLILVLISISYLLIILLYVNYRSYSITHDISAGLQGRYIFPIITPLITFIIYFVMFKLPEIAKLLFTLIITILFVSEGFFYFVEHGSHFL